VTPAAWGGIAMAINGRIADGSFGVHFPDLCDDAPNPPIGTNDVGFGLALRAEVPLIEWPLNVNFLPEPATVMDLIEFCHRHVALASGESRYHRFFGHHHLVFDEAAGRESFRRDINRIFSRNGMAYELRVNGQIVRLAPEGVREPLTGALFQTGDLALDALLESARTKFLSPSPETRKEGLERLWDARERLKTIEPAANKAASTKALLDRAASEPNLRRVIEDDARQLTDVGNTFQIRHHETNKTPIASSEQIDYLFGRLFGLIRLVLRTTARGG
jgi:hypothetical protein